MKLAIVSDLHIGYERFEEDARRQAEEALIAASEEADAILIPGDVFDKRAPKPEVIAQAINIFREISRREWKAKVVDFRNKNGEIAHTRVPIIAIPGTHERVAEGKDNVLKLLALAGLIVDVSESTAVLQMGEEKVAVFGLGGVSEERARDTLERLNPQPINGAFNIFMLHQSIYELLPFSNDIIKYSELPNGFDLYVNGHIHSTVEAMVHGKKFLIPGSTVLTQLKDGEQGAKGFILFDTHDSSHKFRPIKSRLFVCSSIKFAEATPKDVVQRCEFEIEKVLLGKSDKPIIRLKLEGTIAKGFTNADMPIRNLGLRYASKVFLEIDSSKLKSPDSEKSIEELRGGLVEGMSIKELGMSTFNTKLKEHKIDGAIDIGRLFDILSSGASKEKIIKQATELLEEH
ncbi:MAG: exonuclease SbcCD subunit D [Candidatus Micrarchaeales archaeon]